MTIMEKADYVLREKTMAFAIRIVNLYKYLVDKNEFVMSKQVLRSGTSIGANYAESIKAESPDDFKHKMSIARKEGEETLYWLELLCRTGYITEEQFVSMKNDCEQIQKMLTSSILTIMKRKK